MGIFSKKSGSATHNYIWDPNTMLSFRKSYMEGGYTDGRRDARTYRRPDGRTDGQTLFYRTL